MGLYGKRKLRGLMLFACLAAPCATTCAAVNDVLPTDYFPSATGRSTLAVYAYDRKASGLYAAGKKVADGELATHIMALRIGHSFEVLGRPLSIIAVVPWARATLDPPTLGNTAEGNTSGHFASGMGDLRLGATTWVVANRASGQYLGISAMIAMPFGDYDRQQIINIGENRYKATLSMGLIQPLTPTLALDLTPEIAWFGDNADYFGGTRLSQKTAYALTGYLRYRATSNWQFYGGAQVNDGGETRVNQVRQNNAPDNSRLLLGTTFIDDTRQHQWIARVARDIDIKNGFKAQAEFLLRYLWLF